MKYGSLACVKNIKLFQNELHPSPHLFVQLSMLTVLKTCSCHCRSNLTASLRANHEAASALCYICVTLAKGNLDLAKAHASTLAGTVASARLAGPAALDA